MGIGTGLRCQDDMDFLTNSYVEEENVKIQPGL